MRYIRISIDPATLKMSGKLLDRYAKFSRKGIIDLGRHHKEVYAYFDADAAKIIRSDSELIALAKKIGKSVDETIQVAFCPETIGTIGHTVCALTCSEAYIACFLNKTKGTL